MLIKGIKDSFQKIFENKKDFFILWMFTVAIIYLKYRFYLGINGRSIFKYQFLEEIEMYIVPAFVTLIAVNWHSKKEKGLIGIIKNTDKSLIIMAFLFGISPFLINFIPLTGINIGFIQINFSENTEIVLFLIRVILQIILTIKLSFTIANIYNEKEDLILSLKKSFVLTNGKFWKIIGLYIVSALIFLLQFILFAIGLNVFQVMLMHLQEIFVYIYMFNVAFMITTFYVVLQNTLIYFYFDSLEEHKINKKLELVSEGTI